MSTQERRDEPITPEGLRALEAELGKLQHEGRRAIAERIRVARAEGDLKENAEYHTAKEDQAHLETKIKRLRERMRKAVVVETDSEGPRLTFGRTAEILDEASGKVYTWTIVGPTEADLAKGMLSAESPVANALLGCSPGKAVHVDTPGGRRKYRVQKLL